MKIYESSRLERGYKVGIGLRKYVFFKKKKDAEKFIVNYKKITMSTVRAVAETQTNVYSIYRLYHYQLSELDCDRIDESLHAFNKIFNRIFVKTSGGDFAFTNVENIFHYTFDIIEILKGFSYRNKEVALKHQINAITKNLDALYKMYKKERKTLRVEATYLDNPVIKLVRNELKKRA